MYRQGYLVTIIFCIFLLASCASRKSRSLFNASSDIVTDTIRKVYVVNDQNTDPYYKIKIGDQLAVRNVQNFEFGATSASVASSVGNNSSGSASGTSNVISYPVDIDGYVNLPAIGKVQVVGLSRREATSKMQDIYSQKLLVNPIIDLTIVNLKVTVLGEFNKQGNFFIERENTTLIDIIGEAGGVTKAADPKTLKIIRGDRAKPEIIYVNLTDINSLASKKLILQNQDIIVIQQTKGAAVTETLQNYSSILQPLLVVVNLAVLIFTLTR